jgi:hypothetical protein
MVAMTGSLQHALYGFLPFPGCVLPASLELAARWSLREEAF